MKRDPSAVLIVCAALGFASAACSSSDPTGSGGEGTISFTTWGEEYIEDEIPQDPGDGSGFVDGWTVRYDKFLVNFANITVGDTRGERAASMQGARLFDNKLRGVKPIIDFSNIPARAWDRVSYEVAPVSEDSQLAAGVAEADKAMMSDRGYSLYVSGTASKDDQAVRFAWGFTVGTRYDECHSEQDGRDEAGVVVTNNATLEAQLTTHGDHLFYDRLQSSPDPSIETSLRFDTLAAADANDDGEVTLEELDAKPLDVRLYDPSGLGAATQGAFVTSLARTVGHFRGEGECIISALASVDAR
jgi:hypothetical protein